MALQNVGIRQSRILYSITTTSYKPSYSSQNTHSQIIRNPSLDYKNSNNNGSSENGSRFYWKEGCAFALAVGLTGATLQHFSTRNNILAEEADITQEIIDKENR